MWFVGARARVCVAWCWFVIVSDVKPTHAHTATFRPKGMRERRAGLEEQRAAFEARIAAADEGEGGVGPEGEGEGDDDPLREWVR